MVTAIRTDRMFKRLKCSHSKPWLTCQAYNIALQNCNPVWRVQSWKSDDCSAQRQKKRLTFDRRDHPSRPQSGLTPSAFATPHHHSLPLSPLPASTKPFWWKNDDEKCNNDDENWLGFDHHSLGSPRHRNIYYNTDWVLRTDRPKNSKKWQQCRPVCIHLFDESSCSSHSCSSMHLLFLWEGQKVVRGTKQTDWQIRINNAAPLSFGHCPKVGLLIVWSLLHACDCLWWWL